jgi:hypothetical protein
MILDFGALFGICRHFPENLKIVANSKKSTPLTEESNPEGP